MTQQLYTTNESESSGIEVVNKQGFLVPKIPVLQHYTFKQCLNQYKIIPNINHSTCTYNENRFENY